MCCSVLQCVAVCCSVLQFVAVHNEYEVMQHKLAHVKTANVLQSVAECCSVLQRQYPCLAAKLKDFPYKT